MYMKMQRWKRVTARCLLLLCAAAIALPAQAARADEVNLALNKSVEVTREHEGSAKKLVDGDKTKAGRWMTEAPATDAHSAIVDLQKVEKVNFFEITWEDETNCGADFKLYASKDKEDWGAPIKEWKGSKGAVTRLKLDVPVDAQFIKLEITRMNGAYGVSVAELEVWNIAGEAPSPAPEQQTPETNIARKAKVATSSNEDGNLTGEKAIDGNTSARESRWATKTGARPAWIQLDFGSTRDVKTFRVYWETRKPKSVKFQYTDGESAPVKDGEWTTAKETGRPSKKTQTVSLEKAVKARYVRVLVEDWDALDPDGGVEWDNISMHELEVYGGDLEKTLDDWLSEVTIDPVTPETATLGYHLPKVPEGYEIKYNGTDYEQVVDVDGKIYRPLADVTVKASFKIANTKNPAEHAFREIDVRVPGSATVREDANPAPRVLPELREWVGGTGAFAASAAKRVVYGHESLKVMATEFAADCQAITGVKLAVVQGTSAQAGDIFFTLGAKADLGLKDEGYLLTAASDRITVNAEAVAGANWGGKTILQGMKTGKGSFPVGQTRDYPLYRVRSIILDVGRKTFTLDWLKQMTKQMSFYKMNDFQIHLNDNLIPLEYYTNNKMDVFKAYSAFRLESSIKEGGNNGKNKADLTAKDVWYSKADFKEYIEQSAALGVKIVPEIDTPAHSLALTKVRPDLRHGTNGRQNDHLDIAKQYDECLAFVKSIFDEYLTGGSGATFAGTDTIHVGADEYTADGNAYRKFVNDMFAYTEGLGKKARVWGSLTTIKGDVEVKGVSADGKHRREMNLWNPGWADLTEMYNLGFELIDCQDGVFYIVPNAGYYYDYLGDNAYNDPLNAISGVAIPAGDPQVAGGAYAVWNDMCDYLDNGISEYDIYDRIDHSLGLFAANAWGKNGMAIGDAKTIVSDLGDAPNTDFACDDVKASEAGAYAQWTMDGAGRDASGMGRDLGKLENASFAKVDGKQALKLTGGSSYAPVSNDDLATLPIGSDLRVKVKRTDATVKDQILFESPYGAVKAVQGKTGKVGISRENFDYSFNYELPVNEWVELEFKNEFGRNGVAGRGKVSLYVNGKLMDTVGDDETTQGRPLTATCMFPVARIGSKASAFTGYVDDVRLSKAADFASTMELDHLAITAEQVLKGEDIEGMRDLLDRAYALMREAAPSADAISALAAQIQGKLDSASFERADYSRVDAYRQLVGNDAVKALFEPAAARRLEIAADQVRDGLPASMQATVNAYENALVNALVDQKALPQTDLRVVDPSQLKAEANTEHSGEGAAKVLDGNAGSIWHSNYPNSGLNGVDPQITIKAKDGAEAQSVSGVVVTRRKNGGNGDLKQYRIEVSTDGTRFSEAASGTASFTAGDTLEIPFAETKRGVKAVRITYVGGGQGGFASAAEIRLLNADARADVDGLRSIVEFAEGIQQAPADGTAKRGSGAVFIDELWKELQDQIGAARALLGQSDLNPNDVQAQKIGLANALYGLRLDGEAPVAPGELTVIIDDRIPGHEDLVLQVVEGDVLPSLPAPELAGYLFDGWYTDGATETWKDKWDFAKPVNRDLTLTAKWVESKDEPVGPTTPEQPETPEPPVTPEQPGGPQGQIQPQRPGAAVKPNGGLPQTGDNAMVAVVGVGLVAAIAVIAGIVLRRRSGK